MEKLFEEIVSRCAAGEKVGLCTVVAARGSTPQAAGARMLLLEDGRTLGTLGGGCVEAEVRQQALGLIAANASKLLTFKLDHDYGWDDGLICGGTMDIFVQTLKSAGDAKDFGEVLARIKEGRAAKLSIEFEDEARDAKDFGEVLARIKEGRAAKLSIEFE